MESINYKKLFTQKVQHQEFIHKLDEFMEHHNDEIEDQDEQIMGILKYLTEWLVNHILYVDGQIPKGWCSKKEIISLDNGYTYATAQNTGKVVNALWNLIVTYKFANIFKNDSRFINISA